MPKTAHGGARLALRVDLVSRLLDFEYYTGVFKFWIAVGRFRDAEHVGLNEPRAHECATGT